MDKERGECVLIILKQGIEEKKYPLGRRLLFLGGMQHIEEERAHYRLDLMHEG